MPKSNVISNIDVFIQISRLANSNLTVHRWTEKLTKNHIQGELPKVRSAANTACGSESFCLFIADSRGPHANTPRLRVYYLVLEFQVHILDAA